jgi:hypothetical protein
MDDLAGWLINKVGPPKIPVLYNIEYLLKGGGYSNYSVRRRTLSELIDGVLREHPGMVGRILVTPYDSTLTHPKLQLMYCEV